MRTILATSLILLTTSCLAGDKTEWTRIELDAAFRAEGVTAFDVNKDGRIDVIAGDVWYEAPSGKKSSDSTAWKMRWIRPKKKFVAGVGYSDAFANYAYDINRDGWTDLIYVSFPGNEFYWLENPRNKEGDWKQHIIWHSICNESPDFADLDGDGVPELLFGSQPEARIGMMRIPSADKVTKKWKFQPISRPGDPMKNGTFKYYHGLGHGDVNNDGRTDVLIMHGWWEAPKSKTSDPWEFHPYLLSKDGKGVLRGADIHVYDLDLDGDNDLITSSAHAYGIWWFENVGSNSEPKFEYRLIDEHYSQTHAMEFVDVNKDGTRDIVTGKRYYAHNGSDPGGKDEVVMFWYEIKRSKGQPPKFIPHEITAGKDTGIGTQFQATDFNGDGRVDIVLSNKKGVNLLLQK